MSSAVDKMPASPPPEQLTIDPDPMFETVDWSCCCCSRRTGTLVLGAVFLAIAVATFAHGVIVATFTHGVAVADALAHANAYDDAQRTSLAPAKPLPRDVTDVRDFHISLAIFSATHIIANIVLLVGVVKGRPSLLLPWIASYTAMVLLLAAAAIFCGTALSRPLPYYNAPGFLGMALLLALCVPTLYCVLAVYTTFREMRGLSPQSLRWEKVPPSPMDALDGRKGPYGALKATWSRPRRPTAAPPPPPPGGTKDVEEGDL